MNNLFFPSTTVLTTFMITALQVLSPAWTKPVGVEPAIESTATGKMWSFAIKNYRMQHHQGLQRLNITVNGSYGGSSGNGGSSASQLLSLYADVYQFLRQYPNEDDYWEILNRELTKTLLHDHPNLASVTITLEVLPTDRLPYPRASIVSRARTGYVDESWRFSTRLPAQEGPVSYEVEYFYRDGISDEEYPDFLPIHHRVAQLLTVATAEEATWDYVNQDIADSVLQKYPALDSFTSRVEVTTKDATEQDATTLAWH
jgi:hypothetical protein